MASVYRQRKEEARREMIPDPFFFSIPDSHKQQSGATVRFAMSRRLIFFCTGTRISSMDLLRRTGSTIDWRDECVVHSKLSPTRDDQRTTALAGATYSITGARCHCHHPQTQIRFTGFPVLTQLSAVAGISCSTSARSRIRCSARR